MIGTVLLLSSAMTACAEPQDDAARAPEEAQATSPQTLLASLQVDDDHVIDFYAYEGGGFGVLERRDKDRPTVLSDDLKGLSPAALYQRLAPAGAAVPDAVAALDADFKRDARAATDLPPPPDSTADAGEGPALYTDAEQTWFRDNFCNSGKNVYCIQGWDWATSPWVRARWLKATGYVNSGGASNLTLYRWDGAQAVPAAIRALGSNELWSFVFTWSVPAYWYASLQNAGTQVSLAIDATDIIKQARD